MECRSEREDGTLGWGLMEKRISYLLLSLGFCISLHHKATIAWAKQQTDFHVDSILQLP